MFTRTWILKIILVVALAGVAGPGGALAVHLQHYSCEEFEIGAYFDPYETLDSMWKIFYFWGDTTEINPIMFNLPLKDRVQKFRELVEAMEPDLEVEWHRATLLMEPRPGVIILLLYGGTPGAFRALIKKEQRKEVRPYPPPLIKFADVRMKIVHRYIGMMCCEDLTAYALARIHEMPLTEAQCIQAAAKLGFQGPGGRSYLYLQNLTSRELNDEL